MVLIIAPKAMMCYGMAQCFGFVCLWVLFAFCLLVFLFMFKVVSRKKEKGQW